MSATLTICREGDDWFVVNWDAKGVTPMAIDSTAAYDAATARIHQLADAKEGSTKADELAGLVARVKDWEERQLKGAASAPGHLETPRRLCFGVQVWV